MLALCMAVVGASCTPAEPKRTSDHDPAAVVSDDTININAASQDELQRLPFIGERLAAEIVGHRERFGPFRRPENLLLLNGISDKRFREIRHLVRVN